MAEFELVESIERWRKAIGLNEKFIQQYIVVSFLFPIIPAEQLYNRQTTIMCVSTFKH